MKLYAALNQRNQVVRQANLLELIHFCIQSADHLNIALFRAGQNKGKVIASFKDGIKIKLPVNVYVGDHVLKVING